ncbi:hypothetical protein LWF01_12135 [Saxibacter everestensis]|uniref:Nitroreductase n=1 Tax=Saxibacter everestensis TaxID=2909229 RepID=A0ABY8QR46_9MICO|nr:hypothetical protein LWF01_12135 [Brevibacteriaceae bacterium ZFBP1038]
MSDDGGREQAGTSVWRAVLEEARRYPSPHNSQPIKVRPVGGAAWPAETTVASDGAGNDSTVVPDGAGYDAELFYDLDLGLPAESFGIPFGHVCAGTFLESLRVVAAARGFLLQESLAYSDMDFSAECRLHFLAHLRLVPHAATDADRMALAVFLNRRTSRRSYDRSLADRQVVDGAREIAQAGGYVFRTTENRGIVRQLVHINQETLFDDLQNDAVHAEIMRWLRFSRAEAARKADGLSAETMLVNGQVLNAAMKNRQLWTVPGLGVALRAAYLNTMRGVRQLGWLEGPFASPADYVQAGRTFMKIWLFLSANQVSLHPFGTVITNPRSHARLVETLGISETDGSMAWMLFRMGHSKTPPAAHRRPVDQMILGEPG